MSKSSTEPDAAAALRDVDAAAYPPFADAVRDFARIGLLSFGGPAAQIAVMHRIIVEERKWLDEQQFLSALSFCMLLPGPEATQLATYTGWRMYGVRGGLVAGLLFVLPGALVVLALSMIYALYGKVPIIEALFFGIKAAVLVIVVEALLRVAKRALKLPEHWTIAALTFVAIFFVDVPFPLVVALAALFGFLRAGEPAASADPLSHGVALATSIRTTLLWLAIWFVPLLLVAVVFGPNSVLTQIGWFFSKLAVVTFGGAYAVLTYMAQDVVTKFGWLSAGQMMDGLGLAETTPGPLILVTEFVAFLAGYQHGAGGGQVSLAAGILGALIALWATFAPCFLWIFVGAPYIERLNAEPRLKSALSAVTAAVVGVILNLTVWFAMNVLFRQLTTVEARPLVVQVPDPASANVEAIVLSALAFVLLFALHRGIITTLALCGGLAVLWHWAG